MSHNIEQKNGQWSFAFTGDRDRIWHGLGQELPENATRAEWIVASGFNYQVSKAPAFAQTGHGDLIPSNHRFIIREDTGQVFAPVSDQYQPVQPAEIFDWFENYITIDDRFHLDAAGVLGSGERLWATARFNGESTIAGDRHVSRLLMSTSFDASQATRNEATTTRVVCQNTLRLAHANARAVVKTRHSTRFQGDQVARELAQIAQSFADFKVMGDRMALVLLTKTDVSNFLKTILDIPLEQSKAETSTRKLNQYQSLSDAYCQTKRERNSNQDDSGTFGSGDAMKSRAMDQLRALLPA